VLFAQEDTNFNNGGPIKYAADNQFDDVDTTVNDGLGVRWMLSDRIGVNLEGRTVFVGIKLTAAGSDLHPAGRGTPLDT